MGFCGAGSAVVGSRGGRLGRGAFFVGSAFLEFLLGDHFDGTEEVAFEGDGFVALALLPQFAILAVAL